jgi:hypothetical protein
VDIDGDGDLDLFVQEYSNSIQFFENTGTRSAPRYEWRTDKYRDLDVGEWYRFVDLDGDGDHDLVGEHPFSHIRSYRNEGTSSAPRFVYADSLRDGDGVAIYLDRQNIPAFGDIDCDQRLDFLVGRVEGTVARFEAAAPGSERFAFVQEHFEGIEIVGSVDSAGSQRHGANALALADFDGDGDFDLFWGDFFERGVLLIENIGRTCSSPSYDVEPYMLPFADSVRTSGYNAPAPVDFDGDGDLDFLMGVIGGAFNPLSTSASNFYHWDRTASDRFELRTTRFLSTIDLGNETIATLADIDGDGDLDLIVGNKVSPRTGVAAELYLYRNDGTRTAPRFTSRQPSVISTATAISTCSSARGTRTSCSTGTRVRHANRDLCSTPPRRSGSIGSATQCRCWSISMATATSTCSSARPMARSTTIATMGRRASTGSCW